jgi:hypothetical protein
MTVTAGFPSYLIGTNASIETDVAGPLSVGLDARIQLYWHPEDEDFGSWGFQEDLRGAVRLRLWSRRSHDVTPFLSGRAGVAAVERVPFSSEPAELITGFLVGASVGADLDVGSPITRVEVAFDRPTFTTHDDAAEPAGELSVVVAGTY